MPSSPPSEEHAAEHGWGAGELEAAMLLSMTNYHRRERAPFWREHIRRLEDGPTAWVASRDYAYLDRVQVLSAEHAHALLNTPRRPGGACRRHEGAHRG